MKRPTTPQASLSGQSGPASPRIFRRLVGMGLGLILLLGGGLVAYRWSIASKIAELRRASDQARRAADWPELERAARAWAILQPQEVKPWSLAASAARAMGDLPQCAEYLRQLPDAAPIEALHELSLLQMETLVQPLAARQTCQRAVRLYPQDNESSLRLLFIHMMLCERQAATDEAIRAIHDGADSRATYAYLFTANWLTFSNGDELNQFWLEKDPDNETFQVAQLAHAMLHRDSASMAASEAPAEVSGVIAIDDTLRLDALRRRYPQNTELRRLAMSNCVQAGSIESLGELLKSESDVPANDSRLWRFKGWYAAAQEQWEVATDAYARALAICPFDYSSQNELAGVVRRSQGVEAAKALQSKANLGIEVSQAFLQAANFEAVPQGDYEKLADYFQQCGEIEYSNELRTQIR